MKKKYMMPQTEVVDIEINNCLLAGSVTGTGIIDDAEEGDVGLSREGMDMLMGDPNSFFNQLFQ